MIIPIECGFTKIGMDKVVEELVKVKHILDNLGVEFFLIHGVLLGAIRDRRLIALDKDFDFGVMGEEILYAVKDELKKHYKEVSVCSTQWLVGKANKLWFKKYMGEYCLPMELQAFYIKNDYVYHNHDLGKNWKFRYGRLVWPKRLFDSFGEVKFAGEIWRVPNPPEDFLDVFYGKNWRLPKAYSDWRYHCANIYEGIW